MLLLAYLGGAYIHTWLAYKKFYYTFPGLPAVMATTGAWLIGMNPGRRRKVLHLGVAGALAVMALRANLGTPGPDDLVPAALHRQLGLNDPIAYHPLAQTTPTRLGRDLPTALALADLNDGALRLLALPRGKKIDRFASRADARSFEAALDYDLRRREVKPEMRMATRAEDFDWAELFFLLPEHADGERVLDPAELRRLCESAAAPDNFDLGQVGEGIECDELVERFEEVLPRSDLVHETEFGPDRVRAMVLVRATSGGLTPRLAFRAMQYAELLGVADEQAPVIRRAAERLDGDERDELLGRPLRHRRAGRNQRPFPW